MLKCKQSQCLSVNKDSAIFPNSRENKYECSGLICAITKLNRDIMNIYIVTKFGTDCSIFADTRF